MTNPFKNLKRKQQLDIGDDNLKSLIVVQDNYLDIQDKLKALFSAEIPTEDPFSINGRELYEFIGVTTAYKDWFPRNAERAGLTEGIDFCSFLSESTGGRPATYHKLTVEAAKEITMIQNNDLGKIVRRYLIWAEKKLREVTEQRNKNVSVSLTEISTLAKFKMVLQIEEEHEQKITALQQETSDIKAVQTEQGQALESLEAVKEEHDIRLTNLEEQSKLEEPVQPVRSRYRTLQGLQYKLAQDDIMSYQDSKNLAYSVISENYSVDVELELQRMKDTFTRYYNRQVADRGYHNVPKAVLRPAQIRDLSWIKLISTKQDWFDLVKKTYEGLIS